MGPVGAGSAKEAMRVEGRQVLARVEAQEVGLLRSSGSHGL